MCLFTYANEYRLDAEVGGTTLFSFLSCKLRTHAHYCYHQTKCHRYWPGAECIVYGEIAVEMQSEKEKEDWTVREFTLSMVSQYFNIHRSFSEWRSEGCRRRGW